MKTTTVFRLLLLVALIATLLTGSATPTPQTIEKVVEKQVVVTQQVEKVVTQQVEKVVTSRWRKWWKRPWWSLPLRCRRAARSPTGCSVLALGVDPHVGSSWD